MVDYDEIMGLTGPDKMLLQERETEMMQRQMDNPFNQPQHRMPVNDTPISYGGGMAEMLLSDNDIPEAIRKKYWWIYNKDNVLTFLDESRKQNKMLSFDIAIIDSMNSMNSYDDYGFDTELQYGLMRNALDVKLDRALGFRGAGTKNERIILQSQFTEARSINENDNAGVIKEGFFKRLLGRR